MRSQKTLRKTRDLLGLISTLLRSHSHLEKRLDRVSEVARQQVVQRSERGFSREGDRAPGE